MNNTVNDRVHSLRNEMKKRNIDVYIVSSSDSHQSEYVPEYYKGREWISGFTGSAGTAVITQDEAALFTDGRYFIQAKTELSDNEFELHKLGVGENSDHISYLRELSSDKITIGFDGKTVTYETVQKIKKKLVDKVVEFKYKEDLLNKIWQKRPSIPTEAVTELPVTLAGESRKSKLQRLREKMKDYNCDYHIISTLDDIAWLFNIRGSDVEFNPVAQSYAIVGMDSAELFIGEERVNPVLADRITEDNVTLKSYFDFEERLEEFSENDRILVDKSTTSIQHVDKVGKCDLYFTSQPTRHFKAIKNETEVENIKKAMVKDGVALVKTFKWIEETLEQREIKETEVADKLSVFRSGQDKYVGESFNAIVGYNGNGAIIHYKPESSTAASIKNEGVLLIDSGGQYEDGTTDITRTLSFGETTEEFRRHYTMVLKGHIGLDRAVFPNKTRGLQLDIKAREHLWNMGLNYAHGTGHGVGFYLNVHEPPQGFTEKLDQRGKTPQEKGMFSSNEPGYYRENHYGIRIENLILNVPHEEYEGFLRFETLTLFPVMTRNIERSLLTKEEIEWVNSYHKRVFEKLSPKLNSSETEWLKEKCKEI